MTDIGVSCAKNSYGRGVGKVATYCNQGLFWHPWYHKCYNVPRRHNQPCAAEAKNRRACGPELTCAWGKHKCERLAADKFVVSPGGETMHAGADEIHVIFAGDPQLGYETAKAFSGDNMHYYAKSSPKSKGELGEWHSNKQIDAINRRLDKYSGKKFVGTIVVGDLVNVPEGLRTWKKSQFDSYKGTWKSRLKGLCFPMLGNHDDENYLNYERYVGDDAAPKNGDQRSGMNSGTDAIISYITDTLNDAAHRKYISAVDMKTSNIRNDAAYAHNIKWSVGSMAYAFNAGNYKFVQLQNRPDFTAVFRNYRTSSAYSVLYDIRPSIDFLLLK